MLQTICRLIGCEIPSNGGRVDLTCLHCMSFHVSRSGERRLKDSVGEKGPCRCVEIVPSKDSDKLKKLAGKSGLPEKGPRTHQSHDVPC